MIAARADTETPAGLAAREVDGAQTETPTGLAARGVDGAQTGAPSEAAPVDGSVSSERVRRRRQRPRGDGRLARYLRRPVQPSARFVDHGVLQVAAGGGVPHRYRLELSLGLFDHLTAGVVTHWLPGQRRPQFAPTVAVAIFRGRLVEVGARHFWSLYPPPLDDVDPQTPSYPQLAQWTLGTLSFSQSWISGGLDAGVVRGRVDDPGQDPEVNGDNPSIIRWEFGGGLHLRAGTRRWGVTAQVLVPHLLAEVAIDVRFGLFERRPRGGWWPRGVVEDWDRPAPW